MPRVVASIEARMSASRLPGKVLADVNGKPALTHLLNRLRAANSLDGIVLATTVNPADDPLIDWAEQNGVTAYRGSEEDVLGRVVGAHETMGSEIVVEICGDMPLIDPAVIDLAVITFDANVCDVVTTTRVPSFPEGCDPQVFTLEDLAHVADTIHDPAVREHVSLYFYEHPDRYRILNLMAPGKWHMPDQRLQLDYAEDLAFIRAVYEALEPTDGAVFGLDAIIELLTRQPSLRSINEKCVEKSAR